MVEYIKRGAILQIISDSPRFYLNDMVKAKTIYEAAKNLPAADVRENIRGEWELLDDKLPEPDGKWVRCSVCRSSEHLEYNHAKLAWKFCPNCGADMRGDPNK